MPEMMENRLCFKNGNIFIVELSINDVLTLEYRFHRQCSFVDKLENHKSKNNAGVINLCPLWLFVAQSTHELVRRMKTN